MKVTQHLVMEKKNEERRPGREEEEAQQESCLCVTPGNSLLAGEQIPTGGAGGGMGRSPAGLLSRGSGFLSQARSGHTCLENILSIPYLSILVPH